MAIWVIKDGQREGPYEEQDLRELVYEGTYTDSEPAIRDGQYDWTTLGQILGRQPPPAGPAPASTLVPPPMPPMPLMPPPVVPLVAPPPAPAAVEPPPVPAAADSAPPEPPAVSPGPMQVTVTDFDMPFGSMVMLMVKWALASIPALIILAAIVAGCWVAFFAFIAVILHH